MARLEDAVNAGDNGQSSLGFTATTERFGVGVVTLADPIGVLDSCRWLVRDAASAVGLVHAELTAFSGTLGTNQVPTTVLATSESHESSGFTTDAGGEWITFNFQGAQRIALAELTEYMLVLNASAMTGGNIAIRRTDPNVDGLGRSQWDPSAWAFTAADRVLNFELFSSLGGLTSIVDLTDITTLG